MPKTHLLLFSLFNIVLFNSIIAMDHTQIPLLFFPVSSDKELNSMSIEQYNCPTENIRVTYSCGNIRDYCMYKYPSPISKSKSLSHEKYLDYAEKMLDANVILLKNMNMDESQIWCYRTRMLVIIDINATNLRETNLKNQIARTNKCMMLLSH